MPLEVSSGARAVGKRTGATALSSEQDAQPEERPESS
jgi:hypothetical protein